jgi:hypothetical protein
MLSSTARDVTPAGAARDADQQTAGVRVPVRCAESDQRRYEVDALVVRHRAGQLTGLGRLFNHAEAVAQPLHRRAGDEDRTFQRVLHRLIADAPGDGRQQLLVAIVGDVNLAAGQAVDEPGIDGAETQLAAFGTLPQSRIVVQDPLHLGAGEVRIDDEAGLFAHHVLQPACLELVAVTCRAPVLPDDGAPDRRAAVSLPHHHCLALVGDADRLHIVGVDAPARNASLMTFMVTTTISSASCSTQPGFG